MLTRLPFPICLSRLQEGRSGLSQSIFDHANFSVRALARLQQKHDPARLPNDPEAPVRWAAITQAYETLTNPERKRMYDLQNNKEPRWFEDFDFALLSLNDDNYLRKAQ